MNRYVVSIISLVFCLASNAQYRSSYVQLDITTPERKTIFSYSNIDVQSIEYVDSTDVFSVCFMNENYNNEDEINTYSFEWYLSYKGERVSDYFTAAILCRRQLSKSVCAWPKRVPKGYEKYVSVQFGREPEKKDRRDDD